MRYPLHTVSIHAPARGATFHQTHSPALRGVSIHAPARGATELRLSQVRALPVSIHAPARGATYRDMIRVYSGGFQFTLPRGERRVCRHIPIAYLLVSIHAPARGATSVSTMERVRSHGFNSRSREGSDRERPKRHLHSSVSIHAPARGATEFISSLSAVRQVSIHAPARGATSTRHTHLPC